MNKQEFLMRACKIHGDKYDYSSTVIEGTTTRDKIKITCLVHGAFIQSRGSHLEGHGCTKCKNVKSALSLTDFTTQANIAHNNVYDYSKVRYVNWRTDIEIICSTHGSFWQQPNNHVASRTRCPECASEDCRTSLIAFKARAHQVHNGVYDYSKTVFARQSDKIIIICSVHGEFEQTVCNHLAGRGCRICAIQKGAIARRLTISEFVSKANLVHHHKYDYTLVSYLGAFHKITIRCHIHGFFTQIPTNHLSGVGCPRCNDSKGEREIASYLDAHDCTYVPQYQIPNCKHIRALKFDFYLPKYHILLEYQGEQHYRKLAHIPDKTYRDLKKRDQIKRVYCQTNGIKLIEISYLENIETRLQQLLNH